MNNTRLFIAVFIVAAVTAAIRFLPFIIFGGKRKTPEAVLYLGRVLPCAIMGMLVVYCLKDISFSSASGFLPHIIAGAVTAGLYALKKNSLLSVLGGTACFMILLRIL